MFMDLPPVVHQYSLPLLFAYFVLFMFLENFPRLFGRLSPLIQLARLLMFIVPVTTTVTGFNSNALLAKILSYLIPHTGFTIC